MKIPTMILKSSALTLIILSLCMTSCSSDDSRVAEEEAPEYIAETKANLVGEWVLINSTINRENIPTADFEILKETRANFYDNNTYSLVYKSRSESASGSTTSTNTQEGTYSVAGLNQVSFFNSSSEIEYIADQLQITTTSTSSDGVVQLQVDVFVRSDSEELKEKEAEEEEVEVAEEEQDNSAATNNTYDGTAVIAKLLGEWEISGETDACLMKNTITFAAETFEIIQHKTTFNRTNLLAYNLSVSYPMPSIFSGSVTKGNETVTFDTQADCQFVKKSELEYTVIDEETIVLKKSSKAKILLVDDATLKLVISYSDMNGEAKGIEFIYKKV
ncbi:hypothetical protein I2486_07230 [Cellulophaga sp. E16_2]|uniref:hypothetical protein n=1 Tax=Cellulophaga sp. E16_2 TaxID=2789297 RepID=UPI001A931F91|nr:hypothetical protein [Cellulophaga sp. E16_2]MBO0591198.1 hypothetical protein [Cellulophaga sp. E16_2]